MNVQHLEVLTPLGRGKIVHSFPDGTYAVEYDFGGGEIRLPNDPEVRILDRRNTAFVRRARYGDEWSVAV